MSAEIIDDKYTEHIVVSKSTHNKWVFNNQVNIFDNQELANQFVKDIYAEYEVSSKEIYQEYKTRKKLENNLEYNYHKLEDLINKLMLKNVDECEIIKTITETEFVDINIQKIKLYENSTYDFVSTMFCSINS